MRRLSATLIAAVSAAAFTQIASAADLPRKAPAYTPPPPPQVYNWTGFYIGGNAGGHWGTDKITTTTNPVALGAAVAAELDSRSPVSLHPDGFIGGIQLGYNWQVNNWFIGIEGDANWLGGTASRTLGFAGAALVNPGDIMTNSSEAKFLATIRPRVGITFDRILLYATGGVAFGTVKTNDTFCGFGCPPGDPSVVQAVSATTTRTGWTVGGGLEYGITNNWSVKAEYLYVDLGSFDTVMPTCASCGFPTDITVHHKYTDNIARAGLNYRFGAW